MPATDDTLIAETRQLLWVKVEHPSDGKIKVYTYDHQEVLERKVRLTPKYLADKFADAVSKRGKWKAQKSSTERIVAQIAEHATQKFVLHYYSIGVDDKRLASYFILDAEGKKQELPGYFDWQVAIDTAERFFDVRNAKPDKLALWRESTTAFRVEIVFTIVLKVHVGNTDYLGLDGVSALYEYRDGRLIGGLPFGAEDKFLAMCRLEAKGPKGVWVEAYEQYKLLFNAWNVICRPGSELTRIFIEGDPGSGKEVWFEAIEKGSQPDRKGKWETLSATLPTDQLRLFLYGERSGVLERQGFLASCAGGGVFLDEIGKSEPQFRRDLLRVLEAKEFVPIGGRPTKINNVLFIFASTPTDRKKAYDPPDFWTRMDVELSLPPPIKLVKHGDSGLMTDYDEARFHALLGHFWFLAFKENCVSAEVEPVLEDFREKVFTPIVDLLTKAAKKWPPGLGEAIPVSPRRIRSLATTLASEHRWVGYRTPEPRSSDPKGRESAEVSYRKFMKQFVDAFFYQLVQDEQNRIKLEETQQ